MKPIARIVKTGEPWPVEPDMGRFRLSAFGSPTAFIVAADAGAAEELYRTTENVPAEVTVQIITVGQ